MNLIGKPEIMKEVNSSIIERLIYKHGPLSKPKLARMTNLSMPTVNKIVDDLEKKGLIASVGLCSKGAGRKAILYQLNKDYGCIISLYYFWGNYLCKLVDMGGNTLFEEKYRLDNTTSETALLSTFHAIDEMVSRATGKIIAIGVGVPGAVLSDGKLFAIPKVKVWEGFNLKEALSARYSANIYIENDVNLATMGYYLKNFSDELDDIAYIYAGNGMGSGIIINKKFYRGATNFSGEFGFMAPLSGESPQYNYTIEGGYLEKKLIPLIKNGNGDGEKYGKDDKDVLINYFTAIAANYIAIINPAAIVFGGEVFDEAFIEEIRLRLNRYSPINSILVFDGENNKMGIEGLILACMDNIISNIEWVQTAGV
ncbi:MAG: ROK family protein [Oscillospiraceae bacterium]|nr:ROK family protein [Oscillospiraceae bacterium]